MRHSTPLQLICGPLDASVLISALGRLQLLDKERYLKLHAWLLNIHNNQKDDVLCCRKPRYFYLQLVRVLKNCG